MSAVMHNIQNERLLRVKEVSELVGIGKSTVWAWVKEGKFPKPVKLSDRVTVWRESEVQTFISKAGGDL